MMSKGIMKGRLITEECRGLKSISKRSHNEEVFLGDG